MRIHALVFLIVASCCLINVSHAATSNVGAIPGQFAVSETGAATYTIPIAVPPGIAGLEPKLALTYNSQGGNGLLGVGWSLSGLSAITRCPRTIAQDGIKGGVEYSTNDKYCLDGQRLVAVSGAYGASGTEYRTELESFSKIISYGSAGNGPAWFKVWTKSGQIVEYGNTVDSRVEAQGKTSVAVWAVNRISDTKGNYLTVTYTEDNPNGQYYPAQIDYAGNVNAGKMPSNSVRFVYESRPDSVPVYQAGSLVKNEKRLAAVEIYASSIFVRGYSVSYVVSDATGRSIVKNIAECLVFPECLGATVFDISESSVMPGHVGLWLGNTDAPNGRTYNTSHQHIADFNGDGKADYMWNYYGWYVALSNGDGFDPPKLWLGNADAPNGRTYNPGYEYIGDFNGDGKADYMWNYYGWYVALSNGNGFEAPRLWLGNKDSPSGRTHNVGYQYVADFNGDGRSDYMWNYYGWYVALSNGSGFEPVRLWLSNSDAPNGRTYNPSHQHIADFNGDGKADYMWNYYGWYVALSKGDGFEPARLWLGNTDAPTGRTYSPGYEYIGDFNADGKSDYMWSYYGWFVVLSKGDGFEPAKLWLGHEASPSGRTYNMGYQYVADFNGDGMSDYLWNYYGWYLALSNGSGFEPAIPWLGNAESPTGRTYNPGYQHIADFNGDGKADYLWNYYGWFLAKSSRPGDSLLGIANGMGADVFINYEPLTNGSIYEKGSGSVYPYIDFQPPLYVVSSTRSGNGIGGKSTVTYLYGGAKINTSGRGFLGFDLRSMRDEQTGITTTTDYRQDYPYTGLPTRTTKTTANGTLIYEQDTTYDAQALGGTRYFPYAAQSVESRYDLDGSLIASTTTSNQYDAYGNATQISVTSNDGHSKVTVNQYDNDITNWILGRLKRATVTSTTP